MNASHSTLTREPHSLLKMFRIRPRPGKAKKLTQQDLAALIQRDPRSIREWESGARLPSPESLMLLIQVYVNEHVFVEGKEKEEAHQLWTTVSEASLRSGRGSIYPPFDENWFDMILRQRRRLTVLASSIQANEHKQMPVKKAHPLYISWHEPASFNGLEELRLSYNI